MLEPSAVSRQQRMRAYLFLGAISGLVLAMDQWSKFLVRTQLELGETWSPVAVLEPFVRIVHWNNTGAAFGLLPSAGTIFTIIAIGVTAAILYYFPRVPESHVAMRIALALQLGGAVGNLIDRILIGTVTDFISIATFPVFNVADASITVGTALLLAAMWVDERRRKQEAADADQDVHAGGKEAEGA
ncbi:MAG TPA: signal peptidase II [Anaerolineales bacterium]|nr:signal peptidase II [Anaerolineales bacterium]